MAAGVAQDRPATGGMSWTTCALAPFRATAMWIHERTEIVEAIGSHQAGGHQFPEPLFDLAGQMPCGSNEVGEETGSSILQRATKILCHRAQRGKWFGTLPG